MKSKVNADGIIEQGSNLPGVGFLIHFVPPAESVWFTTRIEKAGAYEVNWTDSDASLMADIFRADADGTWRCITVSSIAGMQANDPGKRQRVMAEVAAGDTLRIGVGLNRRIDLGIMKDGKIDSKGDAGTIDWGRIAITFTQR
jgi:hypothetical protein